MTGRGRWWILISRALNSRSLMKMAVTGAAGFVGRHVLAELARQGIQVVAVDRDVSGLRGSGGVEVVELDLTRADSGCFDRLGRPDLLMHLAWGGLPNYKSLYHFEVELPVQYAFLRNMVKGGLKALLVTGTCYEYGMQSGALREDQDPRPNTPYALAKDTLRRQLEFLRAGHPFALTWARLFYLHGEGQAPSSLLPQLKAAVVRGDEVFNMSGGEQQRDYLAVDDVASLLVRLALLRRDAGIVNVCSGQPITVRALVERWIADNGWSIKLNLGHYPYPDYEPMAFWGDRSRLDSLMV